MALIWLPIGLASPLLTGWFALRLLEGRRSVLGSIERWSAAFLLGTTLLMDLLFVAHTAGGVSISRWSVLIFFAIVPLLLAIAWFFLARSDGTKKRRIALPTFGKWTAILVTFLGTLLLAKFIVGFILLTAVPPYFDDVFNNWNLRGKAIAVQGVISLSITGTVEPTGVSSYPPTVPLLKASLALIAGRWNEALVNAPHAFWWLAALLLTAGMLWRKTRSAKMALLGGYLLASLPFFTVHGFTAYADVFFAGHLLPAIVWLWNAVEEDDAALSAAFFRLSAFALALLTFVKNEGLVLYLPLALLVLLAALLWKHRSGVPLRRLSSTVAWYAGLLALILLPWVIYKLANGLAYGNAKPLSSLALTLEPDVWYVAWISLLFEGNWNLFFFIFAILLIVGYRQAFRSPLALMTGFVLAALLSQVLVFSFTSLAIEALQQTGYARGVLQVMPLAVVLAVILVNDVLKGKQNDKKS